MILLDGKKTSQEIKEELKLKVTAMKERGERAPHLAAVLVGSDGASLTYVGSKVRSCEQIGFESTLIRLEDDTTEEALLLQIELSLILKEEISRILTDENGDSCWKQSGTKSVQSF